jgi:hypothetical protein
MLATGISPKRRILNNLSLRLFENRFAQQYLISARAD